MSTVDYAALHSNINRAPPYVVKSRGNYLITEDDVEILDATGGAAVAAIGHNDERITAAIVKQLSEVAYCYAPFFTTRATEDIANFLVQSTQGRMPKVFVVSSGTEAVEAALKMARQYFLELPEPQPSRSRFIARSRSYHGNTLGSLSIGSHKGRRAMYEDILATNVSHVSPCYPYREKGAGESNEQYVARLAQELDDEFVHQGPNAVCAFIAETVSGSSLGCHPAVPGYFKAIQAVCEKHGALLILDEVMSGMGRCGTLHAWEQEGIVPDLQTVAKGLGAGYLPIGALLVGQKVTDALNNGTKSFSHSQTYQGHPVASAAAFAVQTIIQEDNLLQNVRKNGVRLGEMLHKRLGPHPNVGDIRGRGFFWGIELVKDKQTKMPFDPRSKICGTIHSTGLQKRFGISLMPSTGNVDGLAGDMILLAPSFNTSLEELEIIVVKTGQVVDNVLPSKYLSD